jgi:hypothetical protein
MENIIYNILIIIALLAVMELLNLPEWIGRKLRGEDSTKNLKSKLDELEARIKVLESKQSE